MQIDLKYQVSAVDRDQITLAINSPQQSQNVTKIT